MYSYDCDVNIRGLINLLEASQLSGVKRIVFASSAAIYGDTAVLPIHEDSEKRPVSFYGESKLTGEHTRIYIMKTLAWSMLHCAMLTCMGSVRAIAVKVA
jgi:nucleoside-diphosphate-sugar epimerase